MDFYRIPSFFLPKHLASSHQTNEYTEQATVDQYDNFTCGFWTSVAYICTIFLILNLVVADYIQVESVVRKL